tara:strand:- start:8202 stop:9446 length:1245 start_codon:yes stop_codon:yes gene_type:complete
MKRLIHYFIFIILFIFSYSADTNDKKDTNIDDNLKFHVIAPVYPSTSMDSVRIDIYLKIPFRSIQFLKEKDIFKAKYEMLISLKKEKDVQILEEVISGEVITGEYKKTVSSKHFNYHKKSFYLPHSKTYHLLARLTDMDTHRSAKRIKKIDLERFKKKLVVSDLLLFESPDFTDSLDLFPIIPPTTTYTDTVIYIYYEAWVPNKHYSLTTRIKSSDDVLIEYSSVEETQNTNFEDMLEIKMADVGDDKYVVELVLEQGSTKSISSLEIKYNWRNISPYITNLNTSIRQLKYIGKKDELKKLSKSDGHKKEELFHEFWKVRDPTPETDTNELMNEYYQRVKYTNEKFGSFQDGWETARGMVFIMFGPPDDIETNLYTRDGKSYQRWHYYHLNKTFTFVDHTGFGDYELLDPYFSY